MGKPQINQAFIILIIFSLVILTSCTLFKPKQWTPPHEINLSREDVVIVLGDNDTENKGIVIVLDSNKTTEQEENQEEQEENQEEQEENNPRDSEVDFYFLLKGKSFLHFIQTNLFIIYFYL